MNKANLASTLSLLALCACESREPAAVEPVANEAANQSAAAAPPAAAPVPAAAPAPSSSPATPAPPPDGHLGSTKAAGERWSGRGYRLIGTEPFWGGTVSPTEIVYSTPENQEGERIAVEATFAPERAVYTGRLDGRPFVLTLTPGPCSDGMSDNVHAYTARLQVRGESRQGCANPR